jgi:adenylate kinase
MHPHHRLCVVLLGPPGAGKSTQGAMLAERFQLRRIASGELLHQEVATGTLRGQAVHRYLQAGVLAPDDLLLDIVIAAIRSAPGGVVLDGFPRTAAQALIADQVLGGVGRPVQLAVHFHVDAATVRQRLAVRQTAQGRFDDDPAVVERRLLLGRPPADLLQYYEQRGVLADLPADLPVGEVSARITALVANLGGVSHRPG